MRMPIIIPVLLSVLLLDGCATIGNPRLKDDTLIDQIQIGTTTKADVEAILGTPMMLHESDYNGIRMDIWTYAYSHTEINGWYWVPVIGIFAILCCDLYSGETRSLAVRFDEEGVLRGRHLSRQTIGGSDISPTIAATSADAQTRVKASR